MSTYIHRHLYIFIHSVKRTSGHQRSNNIENRAKANPFDAATHIFSICTSIVSSGAAFMPQTHTNFSVRGQIGCMPITPGYFANFYTNPLFLFLVFIFHISLSLQIIQRKTDGIDCWDLNWYTFFCTRILWKCEIDGKCEFWPFLKLWRFFLNPWNNVGKISNFDFLGKIFGIRNVKSRFFLNIEVEFWHWKP